MKDKLTREQKKELVRERNQPPRLTLLEEIGNAVTHGLGAVLALVGMILLLIKSDTGMKVAASLIFGISMFILMLMSCLYHSFKKDSTVKRLWRRFDYTSIYFLIGGTFAPICLVYIASPLSITMFIIQWLIIAFGVTMILIYGPGKWPPLHFTLYFLIGWSGVLYLPDLCQHNQPLLWMILAGGLVYTIGMIPFAKKGNGTHFLWHLFVLGGAFLHWLGIYLFIY